MAEPKRKSYELKEIETQLLSVANQQFQAMLANLLSFIAIERLAYKVNERTRYEVAGDLKSFQVWDEPVAVETEKKNAA